MIQVYFLSMLYGWCQSLLLLSELWTGSLEEVRAFRSRLCRDRRCLQVFSASGLAIGLLLLLFPMDPGPLVLGDLIYALWLVHLTVTLAVRYSGRRAWSLAWIRKSLYCSLSLNILHFLFPGFVLL